VVSGSTLQAKVGGGISGKFYKITATAFDDAGDKHEVDGFLECRDL
jgi:hypothetical protein